MDSISLQKRCIDIAKEPCISTQHRSTEHISTEHISTEHISTEHISTERILSLYPLNISARDPSESVKNPCISGGSALLIESRLRYRTR